MRVGGWRQKISLYHLGLGVPSYLEGGLGIYKLIASQEVSLAKHAMNFFLQPDNIWSAMIRAKYEDDNDTDITIGSFMWNAIKSYIDIVDSSIR